MKTKHAAMIATLLAVSGATAHAAPAGAARGPCNGNDSLVTVSSGLEVYDANGNSSVCYHRGSSGKKGKGGGPTSYYYDDRI